MKNEANAVEYLEGLAPLADNLEKLIAGSNLSTNELSFLSYAFGYLKSAKSHLASSSSELI